MSPYPRGLETVTDAEGHVTRYTYDHTGNILTEDYAGEQFVENSYNEIGLLTTVTTAEGEKTNATLGAGQCEAHASSGAKKSRAPCIGCCA